ncbi:hypothetical protein [Rhodoligotrophos defluvii]|nr:hypothetical protein [Rhodoligotrophos defluvii]
MTRLVLVIAALLLLAGCETVTPGASVRGNSDVMRGSAGVGIPL